MNKTGTLDIWICLVRDKRTGLLSMNVSCHFGCIRIIRVPPPPSQRADSPLLVHEYKNIRRAQLDHRIIER